MNKFCVQYSKSTVYRAVQYSIAYSWPLRVWWPYQIAIGEKTISDGSLMQDQLKNLEDIAQKNIIEKNILPRAIF